MKNLTNGSQLELEENRPVGEWATKQRSVETAPVPREAFRQILVAVDDTEQSNWAVDLAGTLGGRLGGRVWLVHAIEMPVAWTPEGVWASEDIERGLAVAGQEMLARARHRLPRGVTAETRVVRGRASEAIPAFAREVHADLIVMGANCHGKIAHIFHGSGTAQNVVHGADCPVLLVTHPVIAEWREPPAALRKN
jgi:nucleotide-binding universal stress UspA family protein